MPQKRLYRSRQDRMIAGICGGLGEYFNVDPTLIRLATAFLFLWTGGTVLLVYLIAWFIIPEEPVQEKDQQSQEKDSESVELLPPPEEPTA